MCARFDIHSAIELIASIFQIDEIFSTSNPTTTWRQTQDIPIVVDDRKKNSLISSC